MLSRVGVLLVLAGMAHADVLQIGDRAAELDTAVDAGGKPVKLASYRGRWVVITIGAAWCDPCKAELPVWDKLAAELAGRAVFIALDIDDDVADGKAFHAELGLARIVRVYLPQDRSSMVERYGARKMPSTFVIDPGGIVRYVQPGFDRRSVDNERAKLRTALDKLIPKPATKPPAKSDPPVVPPKRVDPSLPVVTRLPPLMRFDDPHVTWWADHWSLPL